MIDTNPTAALPQNPGVEASERCRLASSECRPIAKSRLWQLFGIAQCAAVGLRSPADRMVGHVVGRNQEYPRGRRRGKAPA
jgi:hypothetical protein